jgi:Lrp/AsnC family leucine-responsive transcriptional regulator
MKDDNTEKSPMSSRIDGIDREILSILLLEAATSKADIARKVGLAPSASSERIRRLETSGHIKRYEARLDCRALGKPLLAFVFVTEAKPTHGYDTGRALSQVTGVEELHKIAGDDCYLLKVRAADTDDLNTVIEEQINQIETVTGVRTTIVLKSIAEMPPMSGHDLLKEI